MRNVAYDARSYLTAGELTSDHVGRQVALLGAPAATLHMVEHNTRQGYSTLQVGHHRLTVHDGVRVELPTTEEVRG